MALLLAAVVAVLPVSTASAVTGVSPGTGFGFGFGSGLTNITSPLSASSLTTNTLMGPTGLLTSPVTSPATTHALTSFDIVTALTMNSQDAVTNAEIARIAQQSADAQRQAQLRSNYAAACPSAVPAGTLRAGAEQIGALELCSRSVAAAPSPAAAAAIAWAFTKLGAPYACGGAGRMGEFQFDCSSLVSRAYYEGAGVSAAGGAWAPTTRQMVPWGGSSLASWLTPIDFSQAQPGDLLVYDTGAVTSRHVVMVLADGYMLHTNACGDVAHVTASWAQRPGYLGARRVVA